MRNRQLTAAGCVKYAPHVALNFLSFAYDFAGKRKGKPVWCGVQKAGDFLSSLWIDPVASRISGMNHDYQDAKSGGRHSGLYKRWVDEQVSEIEKSIRSLQEQIIVHEDKIANPDSYIDMDISEQQRDGLINRYWPKEVLNFKQQIAVLYGILKERENGG